jgi:hypothetical protein
LPLRHPDPQRRKAAPKALPLHPNTTGRNPPAEAKKAAQSPPRNAALPQDGRNPFPAQKTPKMALKSLQTIKSANKKETTKVVSFFAFSVIQ